MHNLANHPEYKAILKRHREALARGEEETDDQGRNPSSPEELTAVYDHARGKVTAPTFDLLKQKAP
ncbi:MAG: hypothetical protein ACI9TH_004257 [Kiritimatiellia bacterium]|jgi:hypothetical protein